MKSILLTILILTSGVVALAQSGRIKPAETPTPNPRLRPSVIYFPAEDKSAKLPKINPSPTPLGKIDEDVIKVDSTLIPIPVSVLDANGGALMNLKPADFELKIDGRIAEISDLSRSETPVRLAMLFDNSSSVMIAREFETAAAVKFFAV